jgi:hypothetical protein
MHYHKLLPTPPQTIPHTSTRHSSQMSLLPRHLHHLHHLFIICHLAYLPVHGFGATWNMQNTRERKLWERRHSWLRACFTRMTIIHHPFQTYLLATAITCSPFQVIQLYYYWCYMKCVEYKRKRVMRETSLDKNDNASSIGNIPLIYCRNVLSFPAILLYYFCNNDQDCSHSSGDRNQMSIMPCQSIIWINFTVKWQEKDLWERKKDRNHYSTNTPITSDHQLVSRIIMCAATVPFLPWLWCNEGDFCGEWTRKRPPHLQANYGVEMYQNLPVLFFKSYFISSTRLDIFIKTNRSLIFSSLVAQRSLQGQMHRRLLHQRHHQGVGRYPVL